MHSRKSIINRGIVFIASIFAFAIFSSIRVNAAECRVDFQDENQYLTIGGASSSWQDSGLKVIGDGCSNIEVDSINVNGNLNQGATTFTTLDKTPGHYTIGYNYHYNDSLSGETSGTIYRYLRILNSAFDTSNNYTLATFDFDQSSSVIASFNISDNYFANFVVSNNATYIVVKDALGRNVDGGIAPVKHTVTDLVASKVIRVGNIYYIVGNTNENMGVMLSYQVTVFNNSASITPAPYAYSNPNAIYNSGYMYDGSMYLVGQSSTGYPQIDRYSAGTLSTIYTHNNVKGAYNGVSVNNNEIYAVGYTKSESVSIASGLYTYCDLSCSNPQSLSILQETANTIYNDIVSIGNNKNIIVGESAINQIYANNALAATNIRQGYNEGIILQVSSDGLNITGAYMFGGYSDDTFKQIISFDENSYVVVGTMDNGAASLVYKLNKNDFSAEVDVTSSNSNYKINGIVSYNYGYVYYGELNTNKNDILGVYYPKQIVEGNYDALFLSLDNREFSSYETINLVASTSDDRAKYCYYKIQFAGSDVASKECENNSDAIIDTSVVGATLNLEYVIDANTGVKIYIYRVVNITSAPTPIDLTSGATGILRWHVYNRSYTNTADVGARRLQTTNFNYRFSDSSHTNETIEDMIDYYFDNGNTNSYTLTYVSNPNNTHNTFTKSNQTNAAFASIETARKFAYYQEFSRVVRVDGTITVDSLGANRYSGSGQTIADGQPFYIYYIDYRGNNSTDLVTQCNITANSITNCSGRGGYAFASLNDVKNVIEMFLQYNNYFTYTRNTIYNGSIPASEIDAYKENLFTREYVNVIGFNNRNNGGLTFNVETMEGNLVYSGSDKNVYFGGRLDGSNYIHPQVSGSQSVSVNEDNEVKYYYNANYVFFSDNRCYKVYYTYNNGSGTTATGSERIFCLDTTAPKIEYKKESSDSSSIQEATSSAGTNASNPLAIESDFTITNLIDLDEYAFIYINGERYPITCAYNSKECLENIDNYIKQTFRYDKNDPMRVRSISFSDRLLNTNTFYFIIGTIPPTISKENETDNGFTLVINFYDTNPITSISTLVSQQICSGEASMNCYSPSQDDKSAITNSLSEFNEALQNYIYAIGYRDNVRNDEATLTINAVDDVYVINDVEYVIEDGYFVEHSGYEQSYNIDEENTFTYNENRYYYNSLNKTIQTLKLEGEEYVIDDTIASIAIVDNKFRFEEEGREYEIIIGENDELSVEALPLAYEIYNNNLFTLDDIIYTIDFNNKSISYSNPEIATMKHLELEFVRTTSIAGVLNGGVDIPETKRVVDNNSRELFDPNTGLPAYEIVEESYTHYNLVDGVYTFTISQAFRPYTSSIETSINVRPLEMNLGFAINHPGLEVIKGKMFDYNGIEDTSSTIALQNLNDNFKYPLAPSIVSSSNLSNYENTHFMNRTVYVSYQIGATGVFTIKVYQARNGYGLPSTDNSTLCKKIIIYGNDYEESPIDEEISDCQDSVAIPFSEIYANEALLSQYGVTHVFSETGSFAFNGENTFYNISLNTYRKNSDGQYQLSSVTISRTFYIDSISPIYDDGVNGPTLSPYIYNNDGRVDDVMFNLDENVYRLSDTIGANTNIGFDINWYQGNMNNDYRENKLLLIRILVEDRSVTCNLFQLVNNSNYENDCREYIDVEESFSRDNEFRVVFANTGSYEVTFEDASGNGVTYVFSIDKSAPEVLLTEVSMDINDSENSINYDLIDNEGIKNYYVLSYVKNPRFTIRLEDLSPVNHYCYYFDYGQSNKEAFCSRSTADSEYSFAMRDFTVAGISIDEYFALNKSDMNVTLVIWAVDSLNNGGEESASKILFWIDYKDPTGEFEEDSLNTQYITNEEIDDNNLRENTITVLSSEYSGKTIECDATNGFKFVDPRYTIIPSPYTFIVTCADEHSASSDQYPNTYRFSNNMYMRFYESDGINKGEIFNFGIPSTNGGARWIYITFVDSVGNESENYRILPIIVQDSISPYVEKSEKEVKINEVEQFVDLIPVQYIYPTGTYSTVYLANTKIRITFSEPISRVKTCAMVVANRTEAIYQGDCNSALYNKDGFSVDRTYTYTELKLFFDFTNDIENTYKIIVLEVEDFAGLASSPVVVIIDRINPNIGWTQDGGANDNIEYILSGKTYANQYKESGYTEHIYATDDQAASLTVNVKYDRYAPKITYKNYQKVNNRFVEVDDWTDRTRTYYVLVKASTLNNKKCEATQIVGSETYCFVEDSQGLYYFNSLLEDNSGKVWTSVDRIDSTQVGVYRISYTVTDYAGNSSETIYKKVFVNDSENPDIDIYDSNVSEKLFGNVTSNNPDNFEGKLNKVVSFRGIDSAKETDTRVVLYMCNISEYQNGTCDINSYNLFNNGSNANGTSSMNNILNLGTRLTDGVYKVFVYDIGKYVGIDRDSISATNMEADEEIYSLTHNSAYFYFAISISEIDANYLVHGNKFTQEYQLGSSYIRYDYSQENYYTITNGSKASDVYLVRYDPTTQTYSDVSGTRAIGYGSMPVEFTRNSSDSTILTVTYKDNMGRIIYEVKYKEYSGPLLLHETYHNIDVNNKTIEICKIINGENQCNDIGIVYQVIGVTANIYDDGNYIIEMVDRYGNHSQDMGAFVVDNTPYTTNKDQNKATGVNFWYSVGKEVVNPSNISYFARLVDLDNNGDINVLNETFRGNFNSEFFYAFASKAEAKSYLVSIYRDYITEQLRTGSFAFYGIDGAIIRNYTNMTADAILNDISNSLSQMIFSTYTQNRTFSDNEINQVAYNGSLASSSMYKYAYLLVTTTSTGGIVSRNYRLVGDTCNTNGEDNQECIKVELKIVSANDTSINLSMNSQTNNVICRVSGTGGSGELSGSACNFTRVTSGATYVFIDSDINTYHTNVVYYGITAYTENANIYYDEIGDYIPLDKFTRYSLESANNYVEDVEGEYIWLNSRYVLLKNIINTNLYKNVCEFKEENYDGCVYASYISRFNREYRNGSYHVIPSATGTYYYNYYDDVYYDNKEALMEALNVDSTFNNAGVKCDGITCPNVPVKINRKTVEANLLTPVVRQTNKKTYIELFNETTDSKLFEINTIMNNGTYSEVYSYAILNINGTYYNINQFITFDNNSYRCIIDINLETSYHIVITDRAGNQMSIDFSHSSISPTISYSKTSEDTNSNINIDIETTSQISNISKNTINIYKYNGSTYEPISNNTCMVYLQEINNTVLTKNLTLEFRYNEYYNCAGIYKVEVEDSHGNTNYKEFVFNPYIMNVLYILDDSNNIHEYYENDIHGLIVNRVFRVDIDTSLNYLTINKYASYSNLNLQDPQFTINIKDFTSSTMIGTCEVVINRVENDIYSIYVNGANDHSCDGVYTIDVVNRFSEEVIKLGFENIEGANSEPIVYRVSYGQSQTIEIDTTSPNTSVMDSDSEQYFAIHIDDENANYVDTKKLIEEKTIAYTNKYITVVWGGYEEYSLAYLKHRVRLAQDSFTPEWIVENNGVTYNKDYNASYQFRITTPGVYVCEFMFTDAVGNEDINEIFTIVITIEAPNVGFFEVIEETEDNNFVLGDRYENNQRIGDRTILRCLSASGSSYITTPCTIDDYNYRMVVNNLEYPNFNNDYDLKDIISRDSYWIRDVTPAVQYAEELIISLVVSVKGKDDIRTELFIIIDKKAPVITINGVTVGTTYRGAVTINISQDDSSNNAIIYKCDAIDNDKCLIYDSNKNLIEGNRQFDTISAGMSNYIIASDNSGYFFVEAQDDLGNTSTTWFTLDNDAPTITVRVNSTNTVIAPNMYTNARAVFVTVNDSLSESGSSFTIDFTPFNEESPREVTYDALVGLTLEGKYVLTPIDGVNNEGRSITFYIYRQAPKYTITTNNEEDTHVVNSEVSLSWNVETNELIAPIVSVTIDGKVYEATYNSNNNRYVGSVIKEVGEHTFVINDAAGNRSVIMVTINNTNMVCINGNQVEVKMQAYYNVDSLLIGSEKGITYAVDDVIIFALPSQVSSGECVSNGLLGYRTLDPANSNYLIDSERNAALFNNNKHDFVRYGFISQKAINEINNVGGTVVVFVVTKDIANSKLGYKVGTNFFMEDPIGWSMIGVVVLSMIWPVCRIFIKKKVRVI